MTLEEFKEQLETTGFPVAYLEFPKEEPHDPPFICYLVTGQEPFHADGIVYYSSPEIQVELYTNAKDLAAEAKVEEALNLWNYEKEEGFIEEEKIYLATYRLVL